MKKEISRLSFFMLVGFICACSKSPSSEGNVVLSDADRVMEVLLSAADIGLIEGLYADGKSMNTGIVLLDYRDGKSFSLMDVCGDQSIKRFGNIGHGEKEITLGCTGNMSDSSFVAFSDETRCIVTYNLHNMAQEHTRVHKYNIDDAMFCQIIPVDSNHYVGMGVYAGEYQYVLFDKDDRVLDCGFRLYNSDDKNCNISHKFLSNQGVMVKHPSESKYAAFIFNSKHMDFFNIVNDSINCIRSLRESSPNYECIMRYGFSRLEPNENTIIGNMDLCATNDYVYVLYSGDKFSTGKDKSDKVLVYDWNGNQCAELKLPDQARYIAASGEMLLIVAETNTGEYVIKGYNMENKF